MIVLKDNGDGTYLGADEDGNLFDGANHTYGFDQLTRVVISAKGGRTVYQDLAGDEVIGAGDVETENYTDAVHEKAYRDDGTEKVYTTIEWTAR